MPRMGRTSRLGNRGILLISSYLVLSLFLIYSSAMTLRTNAQQLVSNRLRARYQAIDLTQGSMEQLRDDLYEFFRVDVYHDRYGGDALSAMAWLDTVGVGTDKPFAPASPPGAGVSGTGVSSGDRRQVLLPAGTGQAWIVSVVQNPPGILSPRDVTIEATSTVGGVTKRIRATYRFALASSDIFRYAYFINNYGWFDSASSFIQIDGEVRSNGDFRFTGNLGRLYVDGDVFASKNNDLRDLKNPFQTAQGLIYGDPTEDTIYPGWYFGSKKDNTRPERRKTSPGQPTIGGGPVEHLPYGQGWDTDRPNLPDPNRPDQQKFEQQSTQDIPYLGDLNLYKTLARERGSTLKYLTPGADGALGPGTVKAVYEGSAPLVIIGTQDNPIQLNGPVVVEGDVIIRGYVSGRGTIYAGRNVHIIGDIRYKNMPVWPSIERDIGTGQVRGLASGSGRWPDLGSVCASSRAYVGPVGDPATRCQ